MLFMMQVWKTQATMTGAHDPAGRAYGLISLGLVGALLILIQAWWAPALAAPPRGGTLKVSLNADIRGTNPGVNRDANTDAVMHHLVESLVGYGEDLGIRPVVAKSWQIQDEGRTYVFRLRPDLLFHNGAPVTSAEVRWSWQRYLDPETQWQCRRWYVGNDGEGDDDGAPSVIEAVEAPDAQTVVFRLAAPSTLFLHRLANVQCIPAILHPDSVDEEGRWLQPVGTGPYRLARWRRGEAIEIDRFDLYRPDTGEPDGLAGAKLALAERVQFLVSPDAAATKAALLGGQIDVFHNIPMSSIDDFRATPQVRVLESSTLGWSVLLLQTRDPLLSDPRIRRALAHAIDRQVVANFNTHGYARVNSSAVPVGLVMHTQFHERWHAPDIEKARALLAEAGYRGQPVRIQANRRYENMYANAVVIQAMLHSAGVNAHIEVLDWASHLANYYAGNFQLSTFSFSALAMPALRYYKLIGNKDHRTVYMWESPEAMVLLEDAIATADESEHQRLLDELHERMVEDIPIIGLYNAHSAAAVRSTLQGYRPWPLNLPRLWGVWDQRWAP